MSGAEAPKVTLGDATTLVALGCESCSVRGELTFPVCAVQMLTGVDTSGIPLEVTETMQIVQDGQPVGEATRALNVAAGSCEAGVCQFLGQIANVASELAARYQAIQQ
jgi:hypothetical protein